MNRSVVQRLTWLLFFGRSLGSAGYIAGATIGTIVGADLSGRPALAGVPGAMYLLGSAVAAYPAARLMERIGRRLGLALGFAVGIVGAVICGLAILNRSFTGFLLGFTLMGVAQGFNDLGRYAAAEMHPVAERARAISLVVLGGTVGAVLGPALVAPMGQLAEALHTDALAGPWFASAALFAIGAALMLFFLSPDPRDLSRLVEAEHAENSPTPIIDRLRPIGEIVSQSGTQLAIAAMALGQLVMVMVMAITSLHMKHNHHGLGDVSFVIMLHTLGMFAPSIISGRLADRFGRAPTIIAGAALLIAACLLAPLSLNTYILSAALFLLGIGWNFCYVAGGALLTDTLSLAERGRMQGSIDLLVALISAAGNLGSGLVFAGFGYTAVAWASLAVTLVPLVIAFNFILGQGRVRVAEAE
jgi:MFS family permease